MENNEVSELMQFIGRSFKGSTKNGRMDGEGEYTFPSNTKYVGEMKDGMFHGKGMLLFPNGIKFESFWENGISKEGSFTFADGLQYQEKNWDYCDGNDRRFHSERCNGIRPAGESQMTDRHPPRPIPEGCYDCADGFYDPVNRVLTSYGGGFLRNAGEMQMHDPHTKEQQRSDHTLRHSSWDWRACFHTDRNILRKMTFKVKMEMKYCKEKGRLPHE